MALRLTSRDLCAVATRVLSHSCTDRLQLQTAISRSNSFEPSPHIREAFLKWGCVKQAASVGPHNTFGALEFLRIYVNSTLMTFTESMSVRTWRFPSLRRVRIAPLPGRPEAAGRELHIPTRFLLSAQVPELRTFIFYKMTSWTKISGGDGMLVPDCRNITRLELRDSFITRRNLADLISELPGLKEFKYASTLPPVRDVSELAIGVFWYRVHWDNIDVVDAFEGAL